MLAVAAVKQLLQGLSDHLIMVEATPEELLEFLIDSARYGDTEDVVLAIKDKVQVDGQDSAGRTGVCRLCSLPQHLVCSADTLRTLLSNSLTCVCLQHCTWPVRMAMQTLSSSYWMQMQ